MDFKISEYLDKNNLHHAYLIEGAHFDVVPEILNFIESLGIKTSANPDFCSISLDFLKIKQALDLRAMGAQKSFSSGKKIFIVSINRFHPDAQGVLLKMFEEPIENTHFFLITPDVNVLTKTLISRFFVIKSQNNFEDQLKEAKKFISLDIRQRIDFIKDFIASSESELKDDNEVETVEQNSIKSRAIKFLNEIEYVLHQKFLLKDISNIKELTFFHQIFKTREFLRLQGTPTKTLLESIALVVPKF